MIVDTPPENEQAMNNTISRCSKSQIHRPPPPRNVTAVKRMSRAAAIYEVCALRPVGRQGGLGRRKKDEAGALKLVVRRNRAGPSGEVAL